MSTPYFQVQTLTLVGEWGSPQHFKLGPFKNAAGTAVDLTTYDFILWCATVRPGLMQQDGINRWDNGISGVSLVGDSSGYVTIDTDIDGATTFVMNALLECDLWCTNDSWSTWAKLGSGQFQWNAPVKFTQSGTDGPGPY